MVLQLHKVSQRRGFVPQASSNRRKVFVLQGTRSACYIRCESVFVLDVPLCESRMTSRGRSTGRGTRPQFVNIPNIYSTPSGMQSKKGGQ